MQGHVLGATDGERMFNSSGELVWYSHRHDTQITGGRSRSEIGGTALA
jgi:hypothetical protein